MVANAFFHLILKLGCRWTASLTPKSTLYYAQLKIYLHSIMISRFFEEV